MRSQLTRLGAETRRIAPDSNRVCTLFDPRGGQLLGGGYAGATSG